MKIAICLSGQMRTAIYAWPNIKKFLGKLIDSTDFFIHTWNINSDKPVFGDQTFLRKKFIIPDNDLLEYINIYKPKKYEIESIYCGNEESFQWHSITKSIQLKQEYENSNGFTYDIVIKLRPDMIVHPTISIDNIIDQLDFTDNILFSNDVIRGIPDDVIWFASSEVMNAISKYSYSTIEVEANPLAYWDAFKSWLSYNNIVPTKFAGEMQYNFKVISNKWSIMRTEAIPYHPVDEYNKCVEIDRNIYWDPDSTIAPFMQHIKEDEWKTIIKNMLEHKGFVPNHLEYLK